MSCCNTNCNHDPCGSSFNQAVTKAAQYAQYAQTQANAAAQSAEDANNTWLEFNALYLGAFNVAPTQDNEGNPLQTGALYWNSLSNELFAWSGSIWVSTNFNEFTNFTATGTTTARNLVTRFSDVKNVLDFGADPTGATPSTTAIQDAINNATKGAVFIPGGTYLIDPITISNGVYILMTPETILLQRTATTPKNLITITGDGTVIDGGIIDGNRIALESSYTFRNPYDGCIGIKVQADSVYLQNITFTGWIDLPLYWFSGENGTARDLKFFNGCYGPMFGPHYSAGSEDTTFVSNLLVDGVTIDTITNGTTAQINHALDVNRLQNSTIRAIKMINLGGNTSSGSAFVSGLTIHQCNNCSFNDISADKWDTATLKHLAVSVLSCENCIFSDMTLTGFNHGGLEVLTCFDCDFSDAIIDGKYTNTGLGNSYGVTISQGGIGDISFFTRSSTGAVGSKFRNIHVQRCTGLGWDIKSSMFQCYDCLSIGNLGHGVFIDNIAAGSSGFTLQPPPNANGAFFNFISKHNALTGISVNDMADVKIFGGEFNNNRSNAGITQSATANGRLAITNANCSDDQGATYTNECSYVPGNSDVNNRFQVVLFDNDKYSLGQTITIAGNTGYIYDFNDDVATIQFSAPVTFPEPALTSIGNITTSGTSLSSTSNIQNIFYGPGWIKANGEWRRVGSLTGATTGRLTNAFSTNLSGVAASTLIDSVTTIKTQSYGVFTTATASPLLLKNIVANGNSIIGLRASTGNWDAISDVVWGRESVTVNGPTIQEITFDSPLNCTPKSIYIKINSAITGGATGADIIWRRGGSTVHTENISFTSLNTGDIVNFSSTSPSINLTGTRLALSFTGGNGTGGTLTSWIVSEKSIVQ